MSLSLLADSRLYSFLQEIDADLAAKTRKAGCPCGGMLHSARFPRKPRGGPDDLDPEYLYRLSFCCNREGCRRRATPPSVRFFGRKLYLAVVIVLVSAMRHGPTPKRVAQLVKRFEIDRATLLRWRTWWQRILPATAFWKKARGRLMPPVAKEELPHSLLQHFGAETNREKLGLLLQFLSPLTTAPRIASRLAL